MMTFDRAVEIILALEGGRSNHPQDSGGLTVFGITAETARRHGYNVEHLTREQAIAIYKIDYWQAMRCDDLPSRWRLPAFDAAVQHGVRRATTMLQQAIKTKADGIIGPKTLEAARNAGLVAIARFFSYRITLYFDHPKRAYFLEGWMRRLVTVATMMHYYEDAVNA